jgi:hypothetical protein
MIVVIAATAISYKISDLTQSDISENPLWYFIPLVALLIVALILNIKFKKNIAYMGDMTMDPDDEREAVIVAKATRLALNTLRYSLLGSLVVFLISDMWANTLPYMLPAIHPEIGKEAAIEISQAFTYCTAIVLICAVLITSYIVYCVKWCREYRK